MNAKINTGKIKCILGVILAVIGLLFLLCSESFETTTGMVLSLVGGIVIFGIGAILFNRNSDEVGGID